MIYHHFPEERQNFEKKNKTSDEEAEKGVPKNFFKIHKQINKI